MKIKFKNLDICNFDRVSKNRDLTVNGTRFVTDSNAKDRVDFSGYTAYPGLINSHDHLLGTYFPRVGNGPYLNWKPWDDDLKNADLYKERGNISNADLYLLGYYRQILSGVTTVSDHIPHFLNKDLIKTAYINVIEKYALAHEISSYDLSWGDSLEKEIKKSKKQDIPFVTHIEEGYDEEAKKGIPFLKKNKGLFKNSVLVHCVSVNKSDIAEIAKAKANVVWCPFSNMYMFNDTTDIKELLARGVNVALGTDSPMSGGVNLLEELKTASKLYKKLYKKELSPELIFKMVTINGAKAFKLEKDLGVVAPGKIADFIILKNGKSNNPYKRLLKANMLDICVVFRKGKPIYFKESLKDNFNVNLKDYQKVTLLNKEKYFLIGKPLDLQERINKNVGFKKYLDFFPIS